MDWRNHLVSVKQFDAAAVAALFLSAGQLETQLDCGCIEQTLQGKVLANLFYEPSTRTSSSFAAAMMRQGGTVIGINDVAYSSVSKGENLADTIRTLGCYADIIALRHHEDDATEQAAAVSPVPVINAGNGKGEHPTQALLDLYTIYRRKGTLDGLTVTLMGDLKHGRTVHSLIQLLRPHGVRVRLVAPPELALPPAYMATGDVVMSDIADAITDTDVLYVTRVQKERLSAELGGKVFDYRVDQALMRRAKADMVLMHPLPRVGEIDPAVDSDPRAAYFAQMRYGMIVRMALVRDMVLARAEVPVLRVA